METININKWGQTKWEHQNILNPMTRSFSGTQHFIQRWLWIMLIGMMFVLVDVFGYGMIEQLIFDQPWGERPVLDGGYCLSVAR